MAVSKDYVLLKIGEATKNGLEDDEGYYLINFHFIYQGMPTTVSGVPEVIIVKEDHLLWEPNEPDDMIFFKDITKIDFHRVMLGQYKPKK